MSSSFPPRTVTLPAMLENGADHRFRLSLYRFIEAASRLGECREGFAREMGLTANQFLVVMSVAYLQSERGISISAIAANIGLAATHVTTEVGKLVRLGLLRKRPNDEDRRSVLVSLTEKGAAAVDSIAGTMQTVNDILFRGISGANLDLVRQVCERLVHNSEYALVELRMARMRQEMLEASTAKPFPG